jgi:hypothetical protein
LHFKDFNIVKRNTALFFLIIVNIILLAHAVIPHHHHQTQVCLQNSHCQDDGIAHKHSNPEPQHEHDGKNNSDNCILNQAIVLPVNQVKQEFKNYNNSDYHSHLNDFQFILLYTETEVFIAFFTLITADFSVTSSYSDFVSSSLGLRAPPVV